MAAVTAIAAGVSATAATAGALMSWQEAQAQKEDVEKLKGRRGEQAADILDQIGAEEVIYEDELDMIRKQTALAGSKLGLQTGQQVEGLGEGVSESLTQIVGKSKYGGGASERSKVDIESKYEESMGDLKESYDMSMDEIALRDEEAERQAFLRHEEMIGQLEAQREELLSGL